MSFGFSVRILEDKREKKVLVRAGLLTIGSDYRNSLVLPVPEKELKLAEIKDGFLLLYLHPNVKVKVYANNSVYDIQDIAKLFPESGVIKLKPDYELQFEVGGFHIFTNVQETKEEKSKTIDNAFRKRLLTKENIRFSILFVLVALLIYGVNIAAVINYLKNKPAATAKEQKKTEEPLEIAYQAETKKAETPKSEAKKKEAKSDAEVGDSKKANVENELAKGGFIESAPPPEVKSTGGILAVSEGARSVIINRERSLFSKLSETLDETLPQKVDTGEKKEDKKGFQSVKVEDIYAGPAKKEVKVELEEGEKIKAQQKAPDIRVVVGKRPEAEIVAAISRYKKGFEFIFIEERKKDVSLKGKVTVFFVVDNNGVVTRAEVMDTDITNKEFLDKILSLVKSIKFPPSDKGDTSIKLPLLFFPS